MASQSWYDISVNKSIGNNDIIIKKMLDKNLDKNILNDEWVLWCHDIKDSNWGKDSYIKVYSFNTIEDFWKLYKNLNNVDNIMLFLMKKGIFPLWEDMHNRDGGILEAPNKITINCKVDNELEADRIIVGLKVTHLLLDFLPFAPKLSPFVDLFPTQTCFKKARASSGQ